MLLLNILIIFQVWDVDNLLETVYTIDQCDLKIEKLLVSQKGNCVIALTRGGLSFWNLETGNLDSRLKDNTGGTVVPIYHLTPSHEIDTSENGCVNC